MVPAGPSTGGIGSAVGASTGGPASQGVDSWETWWFFNQSAYLDLRRVLAETIATTAGSAADGGLANGLPGPGIVRTEIVPELQRLLDTERANDTTTGALMALGRIGEIAGTPEAASAVPRMTRALADPNQEIAETAALALGILGTDASIDTLIQVLEAKDLGRRVSGDRPVAARTRAFAAYGLGACAHHAGSNRDRQRIARALTDVLAESGTNADVQSAIVLALSIAGLDADEREKESAAAPWISRQSLVRHVAKLARDPARDRLVRAHAVTALGRLASGLPYAARNEIAEQVLGMLQREARSETEVALSAVQALGKLGGTGNSAVERGGRAALLRALDAPDPQTRDFALIALAEIGGAAKDDDAPGLSECRGALENAVVRGRPALRPWAVVALGLLERMRGESGAKPNEPARQILRETLTAARGRNEVGAAAIALGLCREVGAAAALRTRLAEESEDTGCGYVALSLGMIGAHDAIPALRKVVDDSRLRPQLLGQAAIALTLLGDREAAIAMSGYLGEAKSLTEQIALARALAFAGHAGCIEPLLRVAARKELSLSTRGLAAAALGGIAERGTAPWYEPIAVGIDYVAAVPSLISGDGTGILEIL